MKCIRILNYQSYKERWVFADHRRDLDGRLVPGEEILGTFPVKLIAEHQQLLERLLRDDAVRELLQELYRQGWYACHKMLEKYVPDTPM